MSGKRVNHFQDEFHALGSGTCLLFISGMLRRPPTTTRLDTFLLGSFDAAARLDAIYPCCRLSRRGYRPAGHCSGGWNVRAERQIQFCSRAYSLGELSTAVLVELRSFRKFWKVQEKWST